MCTDNLGSRMSYMIQVLAQLRTAQNKGLLSLGFKA